MTKDVSPRVQLSVQTLLQCLYSLLCAVTCISIQYHTTLLPSVNTVALAMFCSRRSSSVCKLKIHRIGRRTSVWTWSGATIVSLIHFSMMLQFHCVPQRVGSVVHTTPAPSHNWCKGYHLLHHQWRALPCCGQQPPERHQLSADITPLPLGPFHPPLSAAPRSQHHQGGCHQVANHGRWHR